MNSIPLLMNGILVKCQMFFCCFFQNQYTDESMLSITPSKESCFMQIVFSTIEIC